MNQSVFLNDSVGASQSAHLTLLGTTEDFQRCMLEFGRGWSQFLC